MVDDLWNEVVVTFMSTERFIVMLIRSCSPEIFLPCTLRPMSVSSHNSSESPHVVYTSTYTQLVWQFIQDSYWSSLHIYFLWKCCDFVFVHTDNNGESKWSTISSLEKKLLKTTYPVALMYLRILYFVRNLFLFCERFLHHCWTFVQNAERGRPLRNGNISVSL